MIIELEQKFSVSYFMKNKISFRQKKVLFFQIAHLKTLLV